MPLYNPHGSDGTDTCKQNIFETTRLYNPHGSDGTTSIISQKEIRLELYNPHGSDGTNEALEIPPKTLSAL